MRNRADGKQVIARTNLNSYGFAYDVVAPIGILVIKVWSDNREDVAFCQGKSHLGLYLCQFRFFAGKRDRNRFQSLRKLGTIMTEIKQSRR